ncbi:hypothetical protein MITS9509_00976 [Synechococcus sp. MIT S9509]|uniref:hypothetical protein n=1 Tax=Synechococcus sp. MIT S9509 TaxID=1801630 RepID=UPI0007BC7DA8|nr:hypothetical protein [Synechococcus sp. MIT S9509]KZR93099.1 hypothetical protein MITS9509_00976 [Synechococcus sp. MIT S9509]
MNTPNTDAIKLKIAQLSESTNLAAINQLIEDGSYAKAVDAINDLHAEANSVTRACTALASKITKKVWSPLLEAKN